MSILANPFFQILVIANLCILILGLYLKYFNTNAIVKDLGDTILRLYVVTWMYALLICGTVLLIILTLNKMI